MGLKVLALDTETTVLHKGHPFTPQNKLCVISYATENESGSVKIEYDDEPYGASIAFVQRLIDEHDFLVGFNFKRDLHWLRRYGINFVGKRIWCCQLVEFLLDCQRTPYPDLESSCLRVGVAGKLGNAVNDCWDSGVDTPDIPWEVLEPYATQDAKCTRQLYFRQKDEVDVRGREFCSLVSLHNADLLVTAEMEFNGLLLDIDGCNAANAEGAIAVGDCDIQLHNFFGVPWINYDSPKQLSAALFGGSITRQLREEVGVFKTGQKIGQPRYRIREEKHEFPGVVRPLKGSELDGGGWSTAEGHLRSIKSGGQKARVALDLLIRRSELEKLRGTYYEGLPALLSTMGWEGSLLHGQINHCVARTGRTTSSKPNMQNLPPEIDRLFRSRFGPDGLVVAFDAKGLEWVCIAFLAQDETAISEIVAGVDQHEENKLRFGLPDKRVAKYFVFRLIYGGMARTFTKDPDFNWISHSEEYWQKVMDQFYRKYSGIKNTHAHWYQAAIETGRYVSPTGRGFVFTPETGQWQFVRPVILNYPVQSLGADLMAIARVSLFRRFQALGLRSKFVNTVHDSIVLDILKEEWYTINTLVEDVFNDIPKNFKKLFGREFNLPMRASAKQLNGEEIVL